MAKPVSPLTAKLKQILLWVDQPEIVLLQKSAAEFVIATGVDHEEIEYAYVGALVTKVQLAKYQAEHFDLRYLLTHPALRRWYLINLGGDGPDYPLATLKRDSELILKALPDAGLFARGHDSIAEVSLVSPAAVEKFNIDGSWNLDELNKFYKNVEDIYYVFNTMERYFAASTPTDTKDFIKDAFVRPFRGGGSYVALYNSIANDNDPAAQLQLSGVKYNSPGFVEVKARQGPFDEMIALLASYSGDIRSAKKRYHALYQYLFGLGLLTAEAETELSASVREGLESYSKALTENIPNVGWDAVLDISSGNILVAAKVVLSIFRRAEKLYGFFEQGRVQYAGLNVDPVDDMEG